MDKEIYHNFTQLVFAYADSQPNTYACIFQERGPESVVKITYGELAGKVRERASLLIRLNLVGKRVALIFPTGIEFVIDFLSCLSAGVIAVPLNLSRNQQQLQRTFDVMMDAKVSTIMTTYQTRILLNKYLQDFFGSTESIQWLDETMTSKIVDEPFHAVRRRDIAFIQYTSGSTSKPKGVMISHKNILINQAAISEACDCYPGLITGGWLPQFHDMGLIGHMMQPLYMGGTYVFMPPQSFIQRPRRWLELISNYRIRGSASPNFGYDYCVKNISDREDLSSLDLSCWEVALNGSEPVNYKTMNEFSEKFSPYGFNPSAFFPSYGMAETTLFVSGGDPSSGMKLKILNKLSFESGRVEFIDSDGIKVVSCGKISNYFDVKIVNPKTLLDCLPDQIGEIWVTGEGVAKGYWNNLAKTEKTFYANAIADNKNYLRTGDLGFINNGELYVTGRIKEMIIIRGRNIYPYDIEYTCNSDVRSAGATAVFAIEQGEHTQLGAIVEVKKKVLLRENVDEIARDIKGNVMNTHNVSIDHLRLVLPGTIPRTTSGKIRRSACKNLFAQEELQAV